MACSLARLCQPGLSSTSEYEFGVEVEVVEVEVVEVYLLNLTSFHDTFTLELECMAVSSPRRH